jgi:hypothetical protein
VSGATSRTTGVFGRFFANIFDLDPRSENAGVDSAVAVADGECFLLSTIDACDRSGGFAALRRGRRRIRRCSRAAKSG